MRALAAQVPHHRTVLLLAEVAALDDLMALAGVIDAAVVGDALLDAADPARRWRRSSPALVEPHRARL